jgi:AcrR family transcriptional regulator
VTRKYELKRRAERQAETRRRIVEATVALHTSVGPARTSISAIAERAGVQRHTVYDHFPSERELFRACSAHWYARRPFPDPARWAALDEPERRLRTALLDVYGWYEAVESELALFARDASLVAAGAELWDERRSGMAELADVLARGWPRRKAVRAAVGHALEFETWRSIARRQDLTSTQAVDAMLRFVASV